MSRGIESTYSFWHQPIKQPTRLKQSLFIKHKPWEWSTDQSHNGLSKSEDLLVGAQPPLCCSFAHHLVRNGHLFLIRSSLSTAQSMFWDPFFLGRRQTFPPAVGRWAILTQTSCTWGFFSVEILLMVKKSGKPPRIYKKTTVDNGIFIRYQLVILAGFLNHQLQYLKIIIQSLASSSITVQKWMPFFVHATLP